MMLSNFVIDLLSCRLLSIFAISHMPTTQYLFICFQNNLIALSIRLSLTSFVSPNEPSL